jgi:citrate synthase
VNLSDDDATTRDAVADWWATAITRMSPGVIELRGRPIQDLIGAVGFVDMIWLLLRGDLPSTQEASLLEAALVAGVDHGPHAPSIAVARMAATCGVGLNNAIASGVNVLGDAHGGAGQQCVEMLSQICESRRNGVDVDASAASIIDEWRRESRYLPGFGHRFHPVDPRRAPLLGLVETAVADGVVRGDFLAAAHAVERALERPGRKPVPINIDGCTAVIYGELGFPAPLARGLFVLSRSVGILAHAWEETQTGRRNKGPIPPDIIPTFLTS